MGGAETSFWSAEVAGIVALSLKVALVAVAFALPLAFLLAFLLARRRFPGRAVLQALVNLPLVLPPVVTGYALLLLFGRNGPVGGFLESTFGVGVAFRWQGAALAAGLMALPLIVRPIRLALESEDAGLEAAARTLGATPAVTFLTVTLPLALPGVLAGAVLGFAKALGEFGATITFVSNIPGETQILSLAIYSLLQTPDGDRAALTLILVSASLAVGAVLASEMLNQAIRSRRRG